jgi:hemolysin activation/secretion protein
MRGAPLLVSGQENTPAARRRGGVGRGVPISWLAMGRGVLVALFWLSWSWVAGAQTNVASSTQTNAAAATDPAFAVRAFHVRGNTLLKRDMVDAILAEATGTNVTLSQIRKALGNLQTAYRERGWSTVGVTLPQQQLTNATVMVQVTEAPLASVSVVNERYFSSNNVMRALPSLRAIYFWSNNMLNSFVFQRELDLANANADRQIYPLIGPGPEPGTSDLTLKVKDRLPLHSRLELNNSFTPGTPELRVNLNAQYNNLWNYEHQLGIQYSFSPERFKASSEFSANGLDTPAIANYSAYYRMPFGDPAAVQDQIDASPYDFGYNEATHRFVLPTPVGRPELTVFGSRATTDTGVKFATKSLVAQTSFITIESQDSGEDLTLNEGIGARLAVPLPVFGGVRSTVSFGFDFKRYRLSSYNTNNFYITTVITNSAGSQTLENTVSSGQPEHTAAVDYLPFNLGWDGSWSDGLGTTLFNSALAFNFLTEGPGLKGDEPFSGNSDFANAGYSPHARARYTTLNLGVAREQKVYKDWALLFRANGQWADGPLIGNEQFAMGGLSGVRGYRDGEAYGDTGWRVQLEQRTPLYDLGQVDNKAPLWVRGAVFMDYGELYQNDRASGGGARGFWGFGFGATASIGNHFDARVTIAWPLLDSALVHAGDPHVYFALAAQF